MNQFLFNLRGLESRDTWTSRGSNKLAPAEETKATKYIPTIKIDLVSDVDDNMFLELIH